MAPAMEPTAATPAKGPFTNDSHPAKLCPFPQTDLAWTLSGFSPIEEFDDPKMQDPGTIRDRSATDLRAGGAVTC